MPFDDDALDFLSDDSEHVAPGVHFDNDVALDGLSDISILSGAAEDALDRLMSDVEEVPPHENMEVALLDVVADASEEWAEAA